MIGSSPRSPCHNHSGSGGVVVVVVVVAVVPAVEMVVASPRRASHARHKMDYTDRFSCSLGRLHASTSVCAEWFNHVPFFAIEVKAENDMSKLFKIRF